MIKLYLNDAQAINHFNLIATGIKERINSILGRGYAGRSPNRMYVTLDVRNYLSDLLQSNHLKNLIVAPPDALTGIIAGLSGIYPTFIVQGSNENLILRNIFVANGYENQLFDKWNFINNAGIDTCPYCNRNYIYYLSRNAKIKPQIDHFFPTNKYPFFALSYYNLIPSCQTCNGFGAKEGKDPLVEGLINPYLIEETHFKFTYGVKHIGVVNPLLDKGSVTVGFSHSIPGHLDVFKLDKLYEQHSDHVLELVVKSKISYSDEYRKQLGAYKGLTFSEGEIDRMILGNYSEPDEMHKRPLAKLYQDIGRQLGLIV